MAMFYYRMNDTVVGPLSEPELRDCCRNGEIEPDTSIRRGKYGNWIPAAEIWICSDAFYERAETIGRIAIRRSRTLLGLPTAPKPIPVKQHESDRRGVLGAAMLAIVFLATIFWLWVILVPKP